MKYTWAYIRDRKIKGTLSRWFGIRFQHPSETSKVREMVLPFCIGRGCDIGFGGDKVMKVNCVGIDYPQPYAFAGKDKVDIACDVIKGDIPVADNTYDYVYTSHLIEDFADTADALKKFIRILRPGGNLILVFPDQPQYEMYCKEINLPMNPYHVHADMGYDYMKRQLDALPGIQYKELFKSNCAIDYNVVMVLQVSMH